METDVVIVWLFYRFPTRAFVYRCHCEPSSDREECVDLCDMCWNVWDGNRHDTQNIIDNFANLC